MRVLILGDVHGRHRELAEALRQAQADYRIEAAIQVGDFGFYRHLLGPSQLERVRYPVPLHAIDGNHEDHGWLRRALLTGAAHAWARELNLVYQARPSVLRLGASTIGFLGGALHVDRPQKHNWLSGFPNYIHRRDRERAVALFNRERPELLVTHSCPAGIGVGLHSAAEMQPGLADHVTAAGFDAGPADDCGERELSRLWADLTYRPRVWAFGHFHRAHEATIEGTWFVGLSDDLTAPDRRLAIWDTEEKRLVFCPADPSGG